MNLFNLTVILCLAILIVGTVAFIIRSIGSAVHRLHTERRQIVGPDGTWTTRILWTHRKASLGIASTIFGWSPAPKKPKDETSKKGKRSWSWWDGADLFDELFLVLLAAIATVGLLVVAVVVLLLAVELALFVLLFFLFGGGRVLFRHPWTIEVVTPEGVHHEIQVKGLRETRETQLRIRQEIEAGVLQLVAV